ncbi:GDP-mannose 6-dehydrogenase [compost metagenome]
MINNSDVIILGNRDEKFRALVQNVPHGKQVIDLVGFMSKATSVTGRTEGICW